MKNLPFCENNCNSVIFQPNLMGFSILESLLITLSKYLKMICIIFTKDLKMGVLLGSIFFDTLYVGLCGTRVTGPLTLTTLSAYNVVQNKRDTFLKSHISQKGNYIIGILVTNWKGLKILDLQAFSVYIIFLMP